MIEACIFDIGGTLVRTKDALLEAAKEAMLENNLTPPPDEEIFINFGIGHKNVLAKAVSKVYKRKDINSVVDKCYSSFQKIYPSKFLDKFQLLPGAEDCLAELRRRGIKIACQTGMERSEALLLFNRFNLLDYFQVIVAFEDADKPRPFPDAMYVTMKKLGIGDKSRCLYIGDTINDIRFAKNAGVKVACATTGVQKKEMLEKEKPDYLINNLAELLKLV